MLKKLHNLKSAAFSHRDPQRIITLLCISISIYFIHLLFLFYVDVFLFVFLAVCNAVLVKSALNDSWLNNNNATDCLLIDIDIYIYICS